MENAQATRPYAGDEVAMVGVDAVIEIASVPDDQPRADEGVFAIEDQYGETHLVEREGDGDAWTVLIPGLL